MIKKSIPIHKKVIIVLPKNLKPTAMIISQITTRIKILTTINKTIQIKMINLLNKSKMMIMSQAKPIINNKITQIRWIMINKSKRKPMKQMMMKKKKMNLLKVKLVLSLKLHLKEDLRDLMKNWVEELIKLCTEGLITKLVEK